MNQTQRKALNSAIPQPITPLARRLYYSSRFARARLRAKFGPAPASDSMTPIFIIGCGRSGTTILGSVVAMHPQVRYMCEPYDLWAAVDPVTDFLHLYTRHAPHCLLDESAATTAARRRFQRLMIPAPRSVLVEKTPVNTLRIGYLNAIAPGARFIHIVRDGIDVTHSIEQVAAKTRELAFRSAINNWWGVDNIKWKVLALDGAVAGYYADEVRTLTTDAQRGAYEWLVSMREVERWRPRLGNRLIELRLDDLISDPRGMLTSLTAGVGLSVSDESWLDEAVKKIHPVSHDYKRDLVLPERMREDFNRIQETFDFKGRADFRAVPISRASAEQRRYNR